MKVTCSDKVLCTDVNQVCDSPTQRCLPRNGDCSTNGICPTLPRELQDSVVMTCDPVQKVCRAAPRAPRAAFVSTASVVTVIAPVPGATFEPARPPTFSWAPTSSAVLVQVLSGVPASSADVAKLTEWAASVPSGGATTVSWSDGHTVVGGVWQTGAPSPPKAGTHWLWIQAVHGAGLRAMSDFVAFAVGTASPWAPVGAACRTASDCASPAQAMTCSANACRQICGSDSDCVSGACLAPVSGLRLCSL